VIDVVVVGGGPVGLAAAIAARLHGLSVRLVERQRPPIDKACGEGLMPAGVRALAALGVPLPPRSLPFRGIRYLSDGVVAEADFPGVPGRGIRRTELHGALVRRAEEVGVEIVWGTRVESAGVGCVRTAAAIWPCRFVVGADGLRSPLRRALGLGAREVPPARGDAAAPPGWSPRARFGVSRHLQLAPWSERVEVTFGIAAEAYVTPLAADEIGVAILWSGGKGGFDELLATRFPPRSPRGSPARRWPVATMVRGPCVSRRAARSRAAAGSPWSATPPATSTRSPAKVCRSASRRRSPSARVWRRATSPPTLAA
jgi:2-polyprenyl-6-methoxyphenol hydroxylase-like FAD-dependent oxidoreductase